MKSIAELKQAYLWQQLTAMLLTSIIAANIVTITLDQVAETLASHVRTIIATAMTETQNRFGCGLHLSFFTDFAMLFTSSY